MRRERRELKGDGAAANELKQVQQQIRGIAIQEMAARGRLAASTPAGFRERWTLFWANHFTVSAAKGAVAPIAGAFEREAIRPHGTASTALVLGGALRRTGIVGDWPTLQPARLYENRDTAPTLDMRALFKGVLSEHLGIDRQDLEAKIFPDSAMAQTARGVVV